MPSPNDNTLLTANDLGVLSGTIDINDSFNASDRIAYYKFILTENSDLAVAFNGVSLDARLIADINNNGVVENNEILNGRFGSSENFFEPLPAGTYFLQLQTFSTQSNPYSLRLAETTKPSNVSPDPGNSLTQALDLGVLSGIRNLRDYVGTLDEQDYYKFTLTQESNIGIVVSGETRTTPIRIGADRNGNGVLELTGFASTNEVFATRPTTSNSFSTTLPTGTYFIEVGQVLGTVTTQYDLAFTVSATASPNPPEGNPPGDGSGNNPPATGALGVPLPSINFRRGTRGVHLRGSNGRDRLNGTRGNDVLVGRGGNDVLSGGRGNDQLKGNGGNDQLRGGRNDDLLVGGGGRDRLLGQQGNDVLIGGAGNDVLIGGSGADTFVYHSLNDGVDTIRQFEVGRDLFDLSRIFTSGAFAGGTTFQRFTRFVELREVRGSTEVRIDVDGSGPRTDTVTLAVVQGVTGLTSRNFIVRL